MESSLKVSYNLILFFALLLSVFIHVPGVSLQMILLVLIAFTGSIFLIPVYLATGLVFPVFMQGGGLEYIHEPYFLILVLFAFCAVLFRPLMGIKTSRPWVWYPFLIILYLLVVYILFFLLGFASFIMYGSHMELGMDISAFIIMMFSTLVAASLLVVIVNKIKSQF